MRCALPVLLGLAAGAAHGGLLIVYTNYTVPTGQITEFNATVEVPPLPTLSGGQPKWGIGPPKWWIGFLCPHVRNSKPPYDIIQAAIPLNRSGNGYSEFG